VTTRLVTVTRVKVDDRRSNFKRRSPLANHLYSSCAELFSDYQMVKAATFNPKSRYYARNELSIWISMKKRSLKQRRTARGEMMSTSSFKCSNANFIGSLVSPYQSCVGQLKVNLNDDQWSMLTHVTVTDRVGTV
jgi:hypothetical protein